MRQVQRRLLLMSLTLMLMAGGVFALSLQTGNPLEARAKRAQSFSGTWYGGVTSVMQEAIQDNWPQTSYGQQGINACGIETEIGLVNYDSLNAGQGLMQTAGAVTATMAANQNAGASQWGYATPTNVWGGITNIAPDFGTDPRSVAYMTWNYSINNRWFHDFIYRASFVGNNPSFPTQVEEATTNVAQGIEDWGDEPVIAFINAGLHAVLISGVWSTNDPNAYYPANITGLVIRDPEGDVNTSRYEVSISQWMSGMQTPFGYYSLWSQYYGNPNDPDPSIGIYAGANHWKTGFTWVQRDGNYANGLYNPDWAFNAVTYSQMTTP